MRDIERLIKMVSGLHDVKPEDMTRRGKGCSVRPIADARTMVAVLLDQYGLSYPEIANEIGVDRASIYFMKKRHSGNLLSCIFYRTRWGQLLKTETKQKENENG